MDRLLRLTLLPLCIASVFGTFLILQSTTRDPRPISENQADPNSPDNDNRSSSSNLTPSPDRPSASTTNPSTQPKSPSLTEVPGELNVSRALRPLEPKEMEHFEAHGESTIDPRAEIASDETQPAIDLTESVRHQELNAASTSTVERPLPQLNENSLQLAAPKPNTNEAQSPTSIPSVDANSNQSNWALPSIDDGPSDQQPANKFQFAGRRNAIERNELPAMLPPADPSTIAPGSSILEQPYVADQAMGAERVNSAQGSSATVIESNERAKVTQPQNPQANLPEPVLQPIRQLVHDAESLARRGALFSARDEFVHALEEIATARSRMYGDASFSQLMRIAFVSLAEVDDFCEEGSLIASAAHVNEIHQSHATRLASFEPMSSGWDASSRYFEYAGECLVNSLGREPLAAEALHGLGKLHIMPGGLIEHNVPLAQAKAVVFFQAATMIDPLDHRSHHELGVQLARLGDFQQARASLLTALSIKPKVNYWQNLSVIHDQLGEGDLAQLARNEAQLAENRVRLTANSTQVGELKFVSPNEFGGVVREPQTASRAIQDAPRESAQAKPGKRWLGLF